MKTYRHRPNSPSFIGQQVLMIALLFFSHGLVAQSESLTLAFHIAQKGTLEKSVAGNKEIVLASTLIITGELNESDFAFLRTLSGSNVARFIHTEPSIIEFYKLKHLDLSGCRIAGGQDRDGKNYNDNVLFTSALKDCISLNTIVLPEELRSIGKSAFERCKNLENVTIPEGVHSIGVFAFAQCSSLDSNACR